jgi:hypothetical protein
LQISYTALVLLVIHCRQRVGTRGEEIGASLLRGSDAEMRGIRGAHEGDLVLTEAWK